MGSPHEIEFDNLIMDDIENVQKVVRNVAKTKENLNFIYPHLKNSLFFS